MFTRENLAAFGNHLLSTYGVQVHSTDGKNTPLYQREVSHADIENWMTDAVLKDYGVPAEGMAKLPSQFQHGDKARFFCMPEGEESFPGIPCEIIAVHFYPGKVKYDLDLLFVDDLRSRVYNIDSALVLPYSPSSTRHSEMSRRFYTTYHALIAIYNPGDKFYADIAGDEFFFELNGCRSKGLNRESLLELTDAEVVKLIIEDFKELSKQ